LHYREALRLRPDYAEAHNNLGNVLQQQGELDEAVACHREAIRLKPNYAEAYNNLGVVLQRLGRLEHAILEGRRALQLRPNHPSAHNNLGMALRLLGKWDEAAAEFELALRLQPSYPDACLNLAMVRLVHGDFERGWPDFVSAKQTSARCDVQRSTCDVQSAISQGGKAVLLTAEQGLGDTLHFIRYAPLVKKHAVKVIVECQPDLVPLLRSVPGIDELVAEGSALPSFDAQSPLPRLPSVFRTTLETILAAVPYLHADIELATRWRDPIPKDDLRVGIAWQGNAGFLHDRLRSIPLSQFAPLAKTQGARLISLQKGLGVEQLERMSSHGDANSVSSFNLDGSAGAFMDTAALMQNLDLVITSDTAIAHLAGALGVPVWVALPLAPDWRWLLRREDSPWYPSMRLFRQTRWGHWDDVFQRMARELTLLFRYR
jgi:hypothetical protein